MSASLIPFSQATISGSLRKTVDARELHSFLENGDMFANWIKARVEKYGFLEGQDFVLVLENPKIKKGRGGDRRSKDYHLTLDMAKELAMVENNDKGREARRYFIECERMAKQIAPPTDNARLLEAKTELCKLGLSAFPDDAIMQSIVADAIKNTLGGQASLPAPALFQAYEILEEAGFTPKGIRSVGPTFGRLLAKAWREETGQQPLTTKRVIDGATRNVKCYPAEFKAQALGIAMGLHS